MLTALIVATLVVGVVVCARIDAEDGAQIPAGYRAQVTRTGRWLLARWTWYVAARHPSRAGCFAAGITCTRIGAYRAAARAARLHAAGLARGLDRHPSRSWKAS